MPSYVRTGAERAVHSLNAATQMRSEITALGDGGFIILWQSSDPNADGSGYAVRAQRYNAQGVAVGSETLINNSTAGDQNWPRIATLASGGYVVTWDTSDATQDGSGYAIKARLFDASWAPVGNEFRVNTQTVADQKQPDVIALSDGGFLIAWTSTDPAQDGIFGAAKGQRFDSTGAPVGGEFLLNAVAAGHQLNIDLAVLTNGGFVATWQTNTGAGTQVKGQVFNADGTRIGSEFFASDGTGTHTSGRLTALPSGGFLLTWTSGVNGSPAQLFDAAGNKVGAQFIIPASAPDIAVRGDGTLLVTWWDSFGSVKAQVYDTGGQRLGPETIVHQGGSATGLGSGQSVALLANGNVVVSWDHITSGTGDLDIRMQILRPNTGLDLGAAARTVSVAENGLPQLQVLADIVPVDSPGMPITYSIVGGADAARFTLSSAGQLRFVSSPNFEAPTDSNGDNVYDVIVRASDGEFSDDQTVSVTVTNLNEAPEITSNGGNFSASVTVAENQNAVTTVTATDPDGAATLTYSISSGTDRARFAINASTGVLTFVSAPNFEVRQDANGDNVYEVTVSVSDGQKSDTQALSITVSNVNEAPTISGSQTDYLVIENGTAVASFSASDPDGTAVTWSIAGGADAARFAIDAATGALRFVTAPNFEAPGDVGANNFYNVTISASDGSLSATRALTIEILNRNEGPVIVSGGGGDSASVSVPENTGFVTTIVADDPDASDSPFSFSIAGGADAALFTIQAQTGQLFFKSSFGGNFEAPADADGNNVYEVIVAVSDGFEPADTQAVSVTVTDANDAPVITSNGGGFLASVSMPENQLAVTTVTAADVENGPLTYAIAGGADAALFAIHAQTGLLSFISAPDREAPGDAGANNVYNVTVSVSDGDKSDTQQLSITVLDVNDAPVITSNGGGSAATISVAENGLAVTIVAASDPESQALSYSIAGGADASRFLIDAATGALSFLTAPDYEQPTDSDGNNVYEVTVRASDGVVSDTQALSIAVGNANEGVTITSGASSTAYENFTEAGVVTATDLDGDAVSFAIAGGADGALFAIDSATGTLSFLAAPDHEAPADADGDNVYEVAVSASDGTLSDVRTISVTVEDDDEPVVIVSGGGGDTASITIDENTGYLFALEAVDPEGNLPVMGIAGGADAALFTYDAQTHMLRFLDLPNYEAPGDADGDNVYELVVGAYDGHNFDYQTIFVTVANAYEGVSFAAPAPGFSTDENGPTIGAVSATGEVGRLIDYRITGGNDASLFSIDPLTGTLSWLAEPDFESPQDAGGDNVYDLIVRASDGTATAFQTVTVTVGNVDEPIGIVSYGGVGTVSLTMDEGGFQVGTVEAADPEGATVAYAIAGGADAGLFAIDSSTGALTFAFPARPDFEAPADSDGDNVYEVTVAATAGAASATQAFAVTILNANEGIFITSDGGGNSAALTFDEGTSEVTTVVAYDPDGSTPIYSITGGGDASRFTIDSATGALRFVEAPDYETPLDAFADNIYDVIVTASDGELSSSQLLSVLIRNVNEGVTITSGGGADTVAVTIAENQAVVASVSAVDTDGAPVHYSIAGGADSAFFGIDPLSGELRLVQGADFEAYGDSDGDNVYEVIVAADDGWLSDTQVFSITVADVDEPLFFTSYAGDFHVSLAIAENSRDAGVVAAEDPDGETVVYSIVDSYDGASFTIDAQTGILRFVTAPDHESPTDLDGDNVYTVLVAATDGNFFDYQTISIQVGNVNEGVTIASAAAFSAAENNTAVTTIVAGDADGDPVSYAIAGGADAALFAIDAQTGALRFLSAPNYEAPADAGGNNVYDVTVSATDGSFAATRALAVTVGNVNEAVTITSNGGGASAGVSVLENGTAVAVVAATDADGGAVTYSIAGGADASRFTINAATGVLAFVAAPNYEAPADVGSNNVYDVVVSASDGIFTDTQALAVTIGNVNEAVTITSNGGGASAGVSVLENGTAVATVVASDADGGAVTYSIAGGADASRFTINAATGVLAFLTAPNFEAPSDSGANNVYDVIVSASDGSFTDTQALAVTVANVNEVLAIVSNGGGATATVAVVENGTGVTVVAAIDPDGAPVTYSIVGGADSARFTINAQTGALQFVAAPNWELPADSNSDNVYAVTVRASDGQFTDDQALSVSVTNTRDGNNVTGTSSGDSISATSTNVALRTSGAEDVVYGRDGHDNIQGMAGDDDLYGEAGNDVLVGGEGADRLTGGLGKDEFTYNAVSESVGASRDLIMDFSRAQGDKISLSAIDANSLLSGNQAFTFIGASAFSNAPGQLRYETSGGMTTIWGDVNGDGVADLQIQLSGSIVLAASDFVL